MTRYYTHNRVIVLDIVPEFEPSDAWLVNDPDYVAHVECKGASFHMIHYEKGRAVCSKNNCIINKIGGEIN